MAPPAAPALFSDAQAVQGPHGDRGIARYVTEHLLALRHAGVPLAAIALNPNAAPPSGRNEALLQLPELAWNTRHTFRRALAAGPLAFHIASPFESTSCVDSLLPRYVIEAGVPVVATVYDLIPALFPQRYLGNPSERRSYDARTRLLASADLLLAISESTRRDTIEQLGVHPDRIHSIGGGVAPFFRPAHPDDAANDALGGALPEITRPFVLTVAGYEPRKNVEGLLAAWAELPADVRSTYQLVVSCSLPEAGRRQWRGAARRLGLADDEVLLTGFVTDEILRELYRRTALFVFPSEYEGYGLPVAEAIACGAPAITSSTSSLPEIIEWSASTFDPADHRTMAALIVRALGDEPYRMALIEACGRAAPRHTWDLVAQRTIDALATLRSARRPAGADAVARSMALVGPLAPSLSGVGGYNSRVVAELSQLCQLDTYADDQPGAAPHPAPGRFPTVALGRNRSTGDYDAIVYTIGNSDFHHGTLHLARETPGIVWFHDVHLTGLYFTAARRGRGPKGIMDDLLRRSYGRRVPDTFLAGELFDDASYRTRGFRLTAELSRHARGIIVNSHLAARLLRLDAGPSVGLPPITVIPHAFPPVVARHQTERAVPLVVTLGWLGPSKQPDLLLDAVAALARERPVQLAFVGPGDDAMLARLRARAAQLGVAELVTATGAVSTAEYDRWIAEATIAVQLRSVSNGESSGTVCEAMAAGLPVVTSIATARELPGGAVELVDPGIGSTDLATVLGALLDDPARRAELTRRAQEHARSWTYRNAAEAVLTFAAALDLDPPTPSTDADLETAGAS